jgi:hypothetical protein
MLKTYISSILLIFCGNIYSQKQEFIKNLESDIDNGLYPKTTSIIVSTGDKVVYENYFEGKNRIIVFIVIIIIVMSYFFIF